MSGNGWQTVSGITSRCLVSFCVHFNADILIYNRRLRFGLGSLLWSEKFAAVVDYAFDWLEVVHNLPRIRLMLGKLGKSTRIIAEL